MKELIISNYDSACNFTFVVCENGIEIERSHNEYDLNKYGLYESEYLWFEEDLIDKKNEKLQQFDRIIVCEDGSINLYIKDVNY